MKKCSIFLLTILFLNSCLTGNDEQTVTVENRYSISVPSFLKEVDNLNEEASLQYQNAFREFYVIVIDEPKTEMLKALVDNNLTDTYSNDLKGYSDLLLNSLEKSITVSHKSKIINTTVNHLPARMGTISGKVDGIDIFYSFAYLQGKDRYYQIMAWTLSNKESQYREMMNRIRYSLKEL